MKDVWLSLPPTEVLKIVRPTFTLPDVLRLSSSRPRLRHGRRLALLLSKSYPKSVYSLLRSVADSFSSSSSSPNFSNCSSLVKLASVFADYLRSHSPVSQQGPCVAEPEAIFPGSTESCALRSLIRSFAPPFPPLIFLRLPITSPRSLPPAQTKLPIPC